MTFATTTVEVAFASAPLGGSYTWTDITDYVEGFDTKRGRSYELDQMQAGTATIQLDNKDGRFTPGLATGAYYPNVIPRRRVRIRATDPLGAGGAVTPTVDATTTATAAAATTMSWSHTVSAGSNRALFVDIGFTANNDEIGTITYGAQSMTRVGFVQSGSSGTDRRFERWQLVAPTVGTATISVTVFNATSHNTTGVSTTTLAAESTSLFSVDQTTVVGTSVTANGTGTATGTLSPTVPAGSLVLTGLMIRSTSAPTPTGTTTSGTLLAGTNNYLGYGTASGNTSWAWSVSDVYAAIATPVLGASGGGGTPVTVFTGFVESWQQSFAGGGPMAKATMTAVDGFKQLGNSNLLRQYAAAVAIDGPKAYYSCAETSASTTAVDVLGNYGSAPVVAFTAAHGSYAFGGQGVLYGPDTALTMTADQSGVPASDGTALVVSTPTSGYALTSTGSVEFWIRSNPFTSGRAGQAMVLFSAEPTIDGITSTGINITSGSTGNLTLVVNGASRGPGWATTFDDGLPHHIVLSWSAGGVNLVLDGSLLFSDAVAVAFAKPLTWVQFGDCIVGPNPSIHGPTVRNINGQFAGIALYSTKLTTTQAQAHYTAGASGTQGEDESTRIGRVLTDAGWPAGDRALDAGISSLSGATWQDGANALQICQGFATDAAGYVFMNGAGQLVYHNRRRRLNPVSKVTLQESTGLGIEGDVRFHIDDSNLRNDVTVTTTSASAQRVTNATSVTNFGTNSQSFSLNITSANEALDAANWQVGLYANPSTRVETVSIEPMTSDALWNWALNLEIGDTVTLGGLPATAPATSLPFVVEAINHTTTATGTVATWVTHFELSPALPITGFILDDPVFGRLDQNALVY